MSGLCSRRTGGRSRHFAWERLPPSHWSRDVAKELGFGTKANRIHCEPLARRNTRLDSEYLRKLFQDQVSIIRVLHRKLSFPNPRVDVQKYFRFLIAFPEEQFQGHPVASRLLC